MQKRYGQNHMKGDEYGKSLNGLLALVRWRVENKFPKRVGDND